VVLEKQAIDEVIFLWCYVLAWCSDSSGLNICIVHYFR